MRKTVALFELSTGSFKRMLTMPDHAIERNVPEGFGYKEGHFDPLSQRVDVGTGDVVDFQPPKPDDDHEWRENVFNGRPRWVKKADVIERERRAVVAQREIDRLERAQLRPIRELVLDPANVDAKQRVEQIESAIAIQREMLRP